MSRKSRTEYAILGMLTEGPLSGYDLKQLIEQRIAHFWAESLGQIYPTLKQLSERGLVTRKETARESGPTRIEYRITSKGRQHLQQWMHEPVGKEQVRNELLLRMYFGPQIDVETSLTQIEAFAAIQQAMRVQFEHYLDVIDDEDASDLQKDFWRLTLLSGQLVNDARLKWCDQAKRVLKRHVDAKKSRKRPAK